MINASDLELDMELYQDDLVKQKFLSAIQNSGAKVVDVHDHNFDPYGYTCSVILAESHAVIHTYPEYNAIYVDFFACGNDVDFNVFLTSIIEEFQPLRMEYKVIDRVI